MKMSNLTDEGVKALVQLIGQFGMFTDPVMEALISLGPKSLPHLAKGLSCSESGPLKSDKQARITITRPDLSASAIMSIASKYPNAPEIDEIADTLLSCLECGPKDAALLCAQIFPRVNKITQDHKKRLASLIQDSPYLLLKIYSAQLLEMLHETDPDVITTLEETLKSADKGIKVSAAYPFARYVTGHKKALKALLVISKSENKELKEYATGVVEKFGADMLAKASELKDTVRNSLGMTFVYIPPGSFMMGSGIRAEEVEKKYGGYVANYEDEYPKHGVRITKGFYLSQTEVTVGQWRRFAKETGYKIATNTDAFIYNNGWRWMSGVFWDNPLFPQTYDHPVTCVSWNDAQAFMKWLSGKENVAYRLPIEAEWEYACRAESTATKFWGDNPADACKYANVCDRSHWKNSHDCEDRYEFTAPVGQYKANDFRLYDMLGNVAEFCQDRYGDYPSGSVSDPQGP
jgi:formylglycine-generating enzyme required for sulfatase activity